MDMGKIRNTDAKRLTFKPTNLYSELLKNSQNKKPNKYTNNKKSKKKKGRYKKKFENIK